MDDDDVIDLRLLKCGGWKSASIPMKITGKWTEFYSPDDHKKLNHGCNINYNKPYHPPKRPKTALASKKSNSFNSQTVSRQKDPPFTPQMLRDLAQEHRPYQVTHRFSASLNGYSRDINSALSTRSRDVSSSLSIRSRDMNSTASTKSDRPELHFVTVSDINVPIVPIITKRVKGEKKYPMKLSMSVLRQQEN